MSSPFLDPSILVEALESSLESGLVDSVSEIGAPDQAAARRARSHPRALFVTPYATNALGPEGMGNGRLVQETFGIVIQLRHAGQDAGAQARASIRDIRQAIWGALEGLRIDPSWAHLRYVGGELLNLDDDPATMYRWVDLYQTETPAPVRRRDLPPPVPPGEEPPSDV
jgi:hypothetical protein